MSKYARKVVQTAASWTSEWLAGFRLLFRGFKGVGTEDQALTLSLGKTLVYVGMEAIATAKMSGSETFFAMIPSSVTLEKFWRACIGMLSARSSLDRSALALLALLRDVTGVLEDLSPSELQSLASSCLAAVLHTKVDDSYDLGVSGRLDPCVYSESRIHRTILEEDAFDILCRIPRPHFANAVAGALADCPILLDPFSPDHLELFGILEPLLWLSNMPKSIPEGHQALVEGGTCEFLSKIILAYPQESWSLQERGIWRIKGEAMTCLGNIIEKMNAAEELSRVQEDVVTAIVKIRDNEDAPSMQRDQAIFTLRRYKAAAVKNGVSPRCGEQL
ncbi:hypothetical protein FRB90_007883 [Tulasnella sp. 427]|nr:hypothetical protein FRB90_007883 [Tulasnella sp. 427]